LNVSWFDEASAKQLRRDLWRSLLGNPKNFLDWSATEYAKKWAGIASSKSGLIRPHKSTPGDGSLGFLIPDVLV